MPGSAECWCGKWQLLLKIQRSIVPTEAAKQRVNWLIKYIQRWTVKGFSFPFCPFSTSANEVGLNNPFVSSPLSRRSYSTLLAAAAVLNTPTDTVTQKPWGVAGTLCLCTLDDRQWKCQIKSFWPVHRRLLTLCSSLAFSDSYLVKNISLNIGLPHIQT